MQTEKLILYLLRDGRGLNSNSIKEITSVVAGKKDKEAETILKKLLESKDLKLKDDLFQVMAKAKRKMIKINPGVKYGKIKWGRRWTMIIFDIPERDKKTRDVLRYRLQKAGFGMMQGSVWVNPFDVSKEFVRFVKSKGLQWQVKVLTFTMRKQDERETVHRIWRMERLNSEYRDFVNKTVKKFKTVKSYRFKSTTLTQKALDLLSRLTEKEYLDLYLRDPQLPNGLLPKNWTGHKAHRIYQQLDKYLVRD